MSEQKTKKQQPPRIKLGGPMKVPGWVKTMAMLSPGAGKLDRFWLKCMMKAIHDADRQKRIANLQQNRDRNSEV